MRRALAVLLLIGLLLPGAALADRQEIRLSFAGDCTLGGHEDWMNYSIGTFKVIAQEQGFSYFFEKCRHIFGEDDLTLVNLEGVLADSPKGRDKSRKWQFRGDPRYAEILALGGIEMVTLGNNHTGDFGKTGLAATKQALEAQGIAYCVDDTVSCYEKDGIRLAFLGFWGPDFRKQKDWFREKVRQLKEEEGVHAVILNYHGGNQYRHKHNKSQQADVRFAVDCGADLVIGHHPHVLQGMEVYRNRSIVYSLGDFCYGGNRKPRKAEYPAMVLSVSLYFDEGRYDGQRLTIHPFRISGTSPRNNYQPLPADEEQAQEVMQLIQADTPFPLQPYAPGMGAAQAEVPAHE